MIFLEYKKYVGTIEIDNNDKFYGHVLGLKNTILSYEGNDINKLENNFKNGINSYLKECKNSNEKPEILNESIAKSEWEELFYQGIEQENFREL